MNTLFDCWLPVFKRLQAMLCNPNDAVDYADCREACIRCFEQAEATAGKQDVPEDEKEAARFAVIAWMDETVLCSTFAWRTQWQSEPLQRKYLNTTVAGEQFFARLNALDAGAIQARQVFLFCLQNGFHGQHIHADDHPMLQALIAEQRQLCLPESWQRWPNDAPVTPLSTVSTSAVLLHQQPLIRFAAALVLLYGALFFLLHSIT